MTTTLALLRDIAKHGTICSDEVYDALRWTEGIPPDAELPDGITEIIQSHLESQSQVHRAWGIGGCHGEPITLENVDEFITRFRKE
jgi:hypothetical protein